MRVGTRVRFFVGIVAAPLIGLLAWSGGLPGSVVPAAEAQQGDVPMYSAWMLESCTLTHYTVSALTPHRGANTGEDFFDVPVNYNIIKGGGHVVAYDTG